jgi:hypothetical protein
MAGKAHVGFSRRVPGRKGCQVSASFFVEKGIDPGIMTDGTFFGRIRLKDDCRGGCRSEGDPDKHGNKNQKA